MDLSSRYEILDTIATGDFATVLRARDRELGREVAIKQIHPQFLADQQQLARYWREAQLLASLQHPNILTIYDIVRPRGWLILELMQGSLKQRVQGEALDLDSLRIVLAAGLNALHFLHTNGVIHGDVKPGNLLFDAQNRIKLGDFGLARRASNEEGSLLKGTTKYMAPELVSDQFGPVGPASDLYSLGFSAYELMCGSQFESLFPGLATFGRDKQIAWMMWHAAADRNLPEINKVLEGVPDDLAHVIQKLVVKDQAHRYQSAQQALRELTVGPPAVEPTPEEEDAEAAAARAVAAKKKRRLRLMAVAAMAFSVMLCVAMLFSGREEKPPPLPRGVITKVYPEEWKLALASSENDRIQEVSFTRYDRFFVNDRPALLSDLRPDDQVVVSRVRDEQLDRWIKEIRVTRPEIYQGRIKTITRPSQDGQPQFVLTIEKTDGQGEELTVSVPETVPILFNGQKEIAGRPAQLTDLKLGDRAVVHHVGQGTGRQAIQLRIERVVPLRGTVREVDMAKGDNGSLTVAPGEGGASELVRLPFAPQCEVTINRQSELSGRLLRPADLKPGDQVKIDHDTQVVRVEASRIFRHAGVVANVDRDGKTLAVTLDGPTRPITCRIGPKCKLTLFGEPVGLTELRRGDTVEITHDSLDVENPQKNPEPMEVAATRPPDPNRWAILVGIQDYADPSLTRLAHPVGDATLLHDTLTKRYWVPRTQALVLTDEGLGRLKSKILQQLGKIGPDGRLLVYLASHAYRDDEGEVYLAPKDFQLTQISTTGLKLQWVVDELEKCRAGEKLLLLDCSHAGKGKDLKRQPSAAEMIATLRGPPGWAPLRTVTALGSCTAGQRGLVWDAQRHGLFAWCLAKGYAGSADKDRDKRVDPAELSAFLKDQMATLSKQLGGVQTPALVEADNRPPRLTEEAKRQICKLAEYLQQDRIDFDAFSQQYVVTSKAAGKEPEPMLIYALVLLKGRQREEARELFAGLKFEHPDWLLPLQGTAWAWFEERNYGAGISELREMVSKISKLKLAGEQHPEQARKLLNWTGRLREFVAITAEKGLRPPSQSLAELDAAVAAQGKTAESLYQQGRQQARDLGRQIEKRAAEAKAAGKIATATGLLRVELKQLHNYATFPFDDGQKQISNELDRRVPRY